MSNKQSSSAEKSVDSDSSPNFLSPLETAENEKVPGLEHPEKVIVKMKVKRKSGTSKSLVKVKRSRIKSVSKGSQVKSFEGRTFSAEESNPMFTPKRSDSQESAKHPVKVMKLVKSSIKMKVKKKKRKGNAEGSSDLPHSFSDESGKFVTPEVMSHSEIQQNSSAFSKSSATIVTVINSKDSLEKSPFIDPEASSVLLKQQLKQKETSVKEQKKESSKSSSKKVMPEASVIKTTTVENESVKAVPDSVVTVQAAGKSIKSEKPAKSLTDKTAGKDVQDSKVTLKTSGGRQEIPVAPDENLDSSFSSMYIIIGALVLAILYAYWQMS